MPYVLEQFNLSGLSTNHKVLQCDFSVMAVSTPLLDDIMSLNETILNLEVNNLCLNVIAVINF